jgi:Cu-Zn family superoxide dismutase
MRTTPVVLFLASVVVVPVACLGRESTAGTKSMTTPTTANVVLKGPNGEARGEAVLTETHAGVLVSATLRDLPPGEHAFHFHERGECTAPFTSAGGHLNPAHTHHGYENPQGPHAGDLPNVWVADGGAAKVEFLAPGVSLGHGKRASLLDGDGTAIVVHAGPDDYKTDPAGNAGDRIACGVVAGAGAPPRQGAHR